jgi:preprotein translocase subunit SecD
MYRKQFGVTLRNTLVSLMTCLSLACSARQEAVSACPAIEMSAIAAAPSDSTRPAVMLNDTTTIQVSRTPVVTTADITGANASQDGGRWVVNFTVTDDAARRVHDFSQQHVGSHVALVVDGKVHGAPRIAGAITGNSYQIDDFTQADAEQLAAAISSGCRR